MEGKGPPTRFAYVKEEGSGHPPEVGTSIAGPSNPGTTGESSPTASELVSRWEPVIESPPIENYLIASERRSEALERLLLSKERLSLFSGTPSQRSTLLGLQTQVIQRVEEKLMSEGYTSESIRSVYDILVYETFTRRGNGKYTTPLTLLKYLRAQDLGSTTLWKHLRSLSIGLKRGP